MQPPLVFGQIEEFNTIGSYIYSPIHSRETEHRLPGIVVQLVLLKGQILITCLFKLKHFSYNLSFQTQTFSLTICQTSLTCASHTYNYHYCFKTFSFITDVFLLCFNKAGYIIKSEISVFIILYSF